MPLLFLHQNICREKFVRCLRLFSNCINLLIVIVASKVLRSPVVCAEPLGIRIDHAEVISVDVVDCGAPEIGGFVHAARPVRTELVGARVVISNRNVALITSTYTQCYRLQR